MLKRIPKAYILGGGFILPAFIATLHYWSINTDACLWAGFCVISGGLLTSAMRLVEKYEEMSRLLLDDLHKDYAFMQTLAREIKRLRKVTGD